MPAQMQARHCAGLHIAHNAQLLIFAPRRKIRQFGPALFGLFSAYPPRPFIPNPLQNTPPYNG
jgi:hypothetical protein